jgi:hypothetical protein
VEFGQTDAEVLRLAANLVERHQPGVTVEQAVLNGLRGHRSAQLLQAHGRLTAVGDRRGDQLQRRVEFRCCGLGCRQCRRQYCG